MLVANSEVSSLRPGYISGCEAVRRIAAAIAGPGIKIQEAGWAGFRFISETDGRLMIQQDMAAEAKKLPFLRIGNMAACLLRKNEIIASCRITQKIVPESAVHRLEGLLTEKGCMMAVKCLKLEPVSVSSAGRSKFSGFFMTIR